MIIRSKNGYLYAATDDGVADSWYGIHVIKFGPGYINKPNNVPGRIPKAGATIVSDQAAYHLLALHHADLSVTWRVYIFGVLDGLSDHPTYGQARLAAKRYIAADDRRKGDATQAERRAYGRS